MTLWRSKRRYERGRRLSEQADDALYALALLQTDEPITKTRISEVREELRQGRDVLNTIRDALANPEEVDSYTYIVARRLREHYGEINIHAIQRLDRALEILETAESELAYQAGLDDVVEMLETLEHIAAQTSDQEAERMRSHVAHSDS